LRDTISICSNVINQLVLKAVTSDAIPPPQGLDSSACVGIAIACRLLSLLHPTKQTINRLHHHVTREVIYQVDELSVIFLQTTIVVHQFEVTLPLLVFHEPVRLCDRGGLRHVHIEHLLVNPHLDSQGGQIAISRQGRAVHMACSLRRKVWNEFW